MDHGNCDAAVSNLEDQVVIADGCIPAGLSFYPIFTDVVAFICSRAGEDWQMGDGDYPNYIVQITTTCGWYVAGPTNRRIGMGISLQKTYFLDICNTTMG
jgi:hypothetical protein